MTDPQKAENGWVYPPPSIASSSTLPARLTIGGIPIGVDDYTDVTVRNAVVRDGLLYAGEDTSTEGRPSLAGLILGSSTTPASTPEEGS